MIKLHYTTEDIITNTLLRTHVQTLLMIGAVHEGGCLCYHGEYDLPQELFPYLERYTCFIKMSQKQRDGEVFEGLPGRTAPIVVDGEETGETVVLLWMEWKLENFTPPFLHEGFCYVPDDIKGGFGGEELLILVNNGCEIITNSEYNMLTQSLVPNFML